jgi:hypothetical protein
MSALAGLQARFVDAVLGTADATPPAIRSSASFTAQQRLGVYANAYRRRLIEAMGSVFERCLQVIGEQEFEAQALDYVESHPPASRALRWYADDFPEWLHSRVSAPARMADLAIIDRGLRRAFDAADAQALGRDALLALAPDEWAQMRLRWHPALSVARCAVDAIGLWRGEAEAAADGRVETTTTALAFWRDEEQTLFRSLVEPEAELLQRLRADAPLAEACLQGPSPMPIAAAAAALLSWVDSGWLVAIRTADGD